MTYTNPVHDGYFADPFILQVGECYYAYGTGGLVDGLVFEILASTDLVHWRSLGGALEPSAGIAGLDCWAPEVARADGRLFMYYSAGVADAGHHLRVAVADAPQGPFTDLGRDLTPHQPFSIDASPFRDDDGQQYLYYARDFLDGERVGTALVVDRLTDPVTLAGDRHTVLRPTADWQLYARQRPMYGAIYDWHTLEGPFLRKHGGRYYCFFSSGAWTGPDYGVSYAVADAPLGPFVLPAHAAHGPSVLRAVPGALGPGHNAVVTGPNGDDYLVYHAWDPGFTTRRMCIDRLDWTAEGPRTAGPTTTPQPLPTLRTGAPA